MLRSVVERAVPDVSSHVQGQAVEFGYFPSTDWALNMKTLPSFETSGTAPTEIRRRIPKCTSVSHCNNHIAGPTFPCCYTHSQRAVRFGDWLGSEPVWMRRDATNNTCRQANWWSSLGLSSMLFKLFQMPFRSLIGGFVSPSVHRRCIIKLKVKKGSCLFICDVMSVADCTKVSVEYVSSVFRTEVFTRSSPTLVLIDLVLRVRFGRSIH